MNLNSGLRIGAGVAIVWLLVGCDAFVSTEARVERAEEALQNGQFGRAGIELRKVVDEDPRNAQARLLLARLALRVNDTSAAAAELQRAGQAGADAAAVEELEIELLLQSGQPAEAQQRIENRNLLKEPARGVLLGGALLMQGKAPEALAAIDAALAADPKSGRAMAAKADALAASTQLEEAAATADAALAADDKNWEAALVKGRLLLANGDQAGAEAQFRSALAQMGRSANMRQIITLRAGVTEMALGRNDLKTAASDVQEMERLAAEAPATELLAARLALAKGDRRDATARLQKTLQAAPDLAPARQLLGIVHLAEGNLLQAEEQFQRVLAQNPEHVDARKHLAQVRLRMGNPGGAATAITPALAADVDDAQLFQLMSAAQRQDTQSGNSLASLRRSFEDNPSSPALRLSYAQALFHAGRPADALQLVSADEPVGNPGLYWAIRIASLNATRGGNVARAEIDRLVAARPDDIALITTASGLLISQGEMAAARDLLMKGRKADPAAANVILALAQVERSLGNGPAADKLLTDAIAAQPDAQALRVSLVESLAQRGEYDLAIDTLRAAKGLDSQRDLQFLLARLELSRGNLAQGEKALDRFTELAPGDADSMSRAASLLLQARQYDAALARFKKAAEMAPAVSSYHLGIATTQLQRAQPAEARSAAERAAELDRTAIAPVSALAAMDILDKKPDAAVQRAEEWQKRYPDDPAANQLLAETLVAAGRTQAAARVYTDWQKKNPSADGALKLHQLLTREGDRGADQPLVDWLRTNPDDHRMRMQLANHYVVTENWSRAAAEYERVLGAFPNDPMALNNLAWAYHGLNDKRALPTAEKAYASGGGVPMIVDTYGWMLVEQGDVQRGLPLLQRAAEAAPQMADIQLHYGAALGRAGQKKEGIVVLQKAASLENDATKRAAIQKQIDDLRGQP